MSSKNTVFNINKKFSELITLNFANNILNIKLIIMALLLGFYFESNSNNLAPKYENILSEIEIAIEHSRPYSEKLSLILKNKSEDSNRLNLCDKLTESDLTEIACDLTNNNISDYIKQISNQLNILKECAKELKKSNLPNNSKRSFTTKFRYLFKVRIFIQRLKLFRYYLKKHKHYFKLHKTVKELSQKYNKEFEIILKIKSDIKKELKYHIKQVYNATMYPYSKYIYQLKNDLDYLQKRLEKLTYHYPELQKISVTVQKKMLKIKEFLEIDKEYIEQQNRSFTQNSTKN